MNAIHTIPISRQVLLALIATCLSQSVFAQLGIGTESPDRTLEVSGSESQYIRVHSTSNLAGASGLELVRGVLSNSPQDWHLLNDAGTFKILSGDYNGNTFQTEHLRITQDNEVGLAVSNVGGKLHIGSGENATLAGDGFLMLGNLTGTNLIMDNNEIQVRNTGNPADLYIQETGGNTYLSNSGGDVRLGYGSAKFGIGTQSPPYRLSVYGDDWHLRISNPGSSGGFNDWYIGATGTSWGVGDNMLVFGPTSTSSSAHFRLRNVSENNGSVAPISITSAGNQEMLIDGSEIDSKNGSLYINYNSEQNTYINPSGGQAAVGTLSPNATLTLITSSATDALSLQRGGYRWDLHPAEPSIPSPWSSLYFYSNNNFMASVNGNTGEWYGISDQRRKRNIMPLPKVLDDVLNIGVYRYAYTSDNNHRKYLGVMAQDVEQAFPEVVHYTNDQAGIAYGQLAAITLKAIQEQQSLIDALEMEVRRLENQ